MASGGGVGSAWPIAPYTEVLVWISPPAPKLSPMLRTKRSSPTWLVEFPLNKIVGADAVQRKAVAGVALAVGENGLIAQAGVGCPRRPENRHERRGS